MELIPGLLTIGIPTFNGGANLPELLISVENMGLKPHQYELLIVDNCSADGTDQIVDQLRLIYPNIRYYKNEANLGRVENWNRVLELVRGEYLILMNVNDRFMTIDIAMQLSYLAQNPEVPLIMNDVISGSYQYPNWKQAGLVNFKTYIRKTFLDINHLEFNSLGILQQHIFRTRVILDHQLRFEPRIARTTDRVFIAEVIKKGGGRFFYTGEILVEWNPLANRYHSTVHHTLNQFSFENLWVNEYCANTQVAALAGVPLQNAIESQMIFARFLMLGKMFRSVKKVFRKAKSPETNLEMHTSNMFYNYLKNQARTKKIPIDYFAVNWLAGVRAVKWFFNSLKPGMVVDRSLQGIIKPVGIRLSGTDLEGSYV